MYIFKLIYFVIFIANIEKSRCQISDKRLCVDEKCSEPVSLGKTLLLYSSPSEGILSFKKNEPVKIYSKQAGSRTNLWGVKINGKRGYVPWMYIRETKILNKPTVLVDTEAVSSPKVPSLNQESVVPSLVGKNYQVIDGTTIYDSPPEVITPTPTAAPSVATSTVAHIDEANVQESVEPKSQTSNDEVVEVKEGIVGGIISAISSKFGKTEPTEITDDEEDGDDDEDEGDEDDGEDEEDENIDEQPQPGTGNPSTPGPEQVSNLEPSKANIKMDIPKLSPYNQQIDPKVLENVLKDDPSFETKSSIESDVKVKEAPVGFKVNPQESPSKAIENGDKDTVEGIIKHSEGLSSVKDTSTDAQESLKREDVADVKQPVVQAEVFKETIHQAFNTETISESHSKTLEGMKETVDTKSPEVLLAEKPVEYKTEDVYAKIPEVLPAEKPVEDKVEAVDAKTPEVLNIEKPGEAKMEAVDSKIPEVLPTEKPVEYKMEAVDAKTPEVLNTEKPVEDKMEAVDAKIPEVSPTEKPVEYKMEAVDAKIPEVLPTEKEAASYESITTTTPVVNFEGVTINPLHYEAKTEGHVEASPILESQSSTVTEYSLEPAVTSGENISDTNNSTEVHTQEPVTSDSGLPMSEEKLETTMQNEIGEASNTASNDAQGTNEGNDEDADNNEESQRQDAEVESKDVVIGDKTELEVAANSVEGTVIEETKVERVTETAELEETEAVQDPPKNDPEESGIMSKLFSFFSSSDEEIKPEAEENMWKHESQAEQFESCQAVGKQDHFLNFNSDIFLYLITTAISCIIFLFLYLTNEKSRREGPLIAKINKLEKDLFVLAKENELLQEQHPVSVQDSYDQSIVVDLNNQLLQMSEIKQIMEQQVAELNLELERRQGLEEQIETLEKELETSTEVGMELNRIISEMLVPTNGAEKLKENVEQLQRQLLEQKETISTTQNLLSIKEMENGALQTDIGEYKKKVNGLQSQLDQLLEKVVSIEKEKEEQHRVLQKEVSLYQQKCTEAGRKEDLLHSKIQTLNAKIVEVQQLAELKIKEYDTLKEEVSKIKALDDSTNLESLFNVSSIKAQLEQLKSEKEKYASQLQQEQMLKTDMERKYRVLVDEMDSLQRRYDDSDKERTEATMKLEVLNNYFKKRESELQEEVLKYKSIFEAKEGAATSTSERIKLMLEEIENYKSQNETLKQEILSQEIDLKSQISVLEKKVHENWVIARQTERKLEDARQESAQLRNRLTMRERAFIEERTQNRLQSPIDQNGEAALSPHPSLDSPASPPPLFGTNNRDHITKSPPLPGLPPPPFLPPLPGAPFMPPPLPGMPPFMPPPPNVYPSDHRPPPLGRMSSPPPPLNSRYSPDTSAFSPYDRNSPSPYDSEYGTTPPVRGYSPFNGRDDRRDYGRQTHSRSNNRNKKGPAMSSGSDHSNDSLDKHHRKQSKMV